MVTTIDMERLERGARAMARPSGRTEEELLEELSYLHDGITALQSLDDLGSAEANESAMSDIDALIARYDRALFKLAQVRAAKAAGEGR